MIKVNWQIANCKTHSNIHVEINVFNARNIYAMTTINIMDLLYW